MPVEILTNTIDDSIHWSLPPRVGRIGEGHHVSHSQSLSHFHFLFPSLFCVVCICISGALFDFHFFFWNCECNPTCPLYFINKSKKRSSKIKTYNLTDTVLSSSIPTTTPSWSPAAA